MRGFPAAIGLGYGIGLKLMSRTGYDLARSSDATSTKTIVDRTSSFTEDGEMGRTSDLQGEVERDGEISESGVVERSSSFTQG